MSKEAVKYARKQIGVAVKAYRFEVKKYRLFKKQTSIKDTLKQMGVPNRSISVICYDTPAQKIKVRVGV